MQKLDTITLQNQSGFSEVCPVLFVSQYFPDMTPGNFCATCNYKENAIEQKGQSLQLGHPLIRQSLVEVYCNISFSAFTITERNTIKLYVVV